MLRVTEDLIEVRHWAEHHGGRPCRRLDGALALCFGREASPGLVVEWAEFESNFVLGRCVLVYDEAPGSHRCFVGPEREARAYLDALDPCTRGAAGPTP